MTDEDEPELPEEFSDRFAGRRDWLDEIQAQLDKDFKCELEAMALAPPRERGRGKLSFQNLSHFVEEAIVSRDWLE